MAVINYVVSLRRLKRRIRERCRYVPVALEAKARPFVMVKEDRQPTIKPTLKDKLPKRTSMDALLSAYQHCMHPADLPKVSMSPACGAVIAGESCGSRAPLVAQR